jgi:hypothetical protein
MAESDDSGLSGMLGTLNSTQAQGVKYIGLLIQAIREAFPNWVNVPASATAPGVAGQVAYAPGFLYICVSSNTWQRVAIATF